MHQKSNKKTKYLAFCYPHAQSMSVIVSVVSTRTHQEMRQRTWTFLRRHRTCRSQYLRPSNRVIRVCFAQI